MWSVKHKSGTVLFVTNCERTANNRREMGWIVEKAKVTSRDQFEEWLIKYCGEIDYYFSEMATERHSNGDYKITWVDSAWIGWQASRESIEIELPNVYGGKYTPSSITMDGFDFEEYLTDLYAAIEQANVKVKK